MLEKNNSYQSWQPMTTNLTTKGTKPPYYGNLAVAAFTHKPSTSSLLQISHLASSSEFTSFYTAHVNRSLSRILIIDLHTYNTTATNNYTRPFSQRPVQTHEFVLPKSCARGKARVGVQRLLANGSDATTGITWDAASYNVELDEGKPVWLGNVTRGERVAVDGKGRVRVEVPWSSVAVLNLDC
jgi:hypothetical protein